MTQPFAAPPRSDFSKDQLPTPVVEKARAKVNLTLHIRGKRPDGYHELESLVVFADVCDELTFAPAVSDNLTVEGPFAGAVDGENLVLKAKRAVESWLGLEIHGDFRLRKHIPVAAGLGGGSSDAAAALRALMKTYARAFDNAAYFAKAAAIGADVPVCLHDGPAWMCGLGERVTPISGIGPLPAILVNPRLKLSTAAVFKMLNAAPFDPASEYEGAVIPTEWNSPAEAADLLKNGRNDLEGPAIALEPAVAGVLNSIREEESCLLARLSGSGPTCFGIFPSQGHAELAARRIAGRYPHWWVAPTSLS